MKVGMRTPSPTRSVKAKTTGRLKRAVNKSVNPVYGHKGIGYIKDPERAVKNRIYHKVTYDPLQPMKDAEWPEMEQETKSFSVYRFFVIVFAIASIYLAFMSVYKLIAYNELHIIPATGAVVCFILFVGMKYNEE